MTWYTYEISPIDFCWQYLKTVNQTARELGADSAASAAQGYAGITDVRVEDFLEAWKSAYGGEKIVGEPVVFWLPVDESFKYGFVYKTDTNGTTYAISPAELPHLGDPITID